MEEMDERIEEPTQQVDVRVIETDGESLLIERLDNYRRYYAPASKVLDRQIAQPDLDKCPLYGIPWEDYLGLQDITADALALMLRQARIYTLADLRVRDRQLIRIGTNLIGKVVRDAATRADEAKPPRRN